MGSSSLRAKGHRVELGLSLFEMHGLGLEIQSYGILWRISKMRNSEKLPNESVTWQMHFHPTWIVTNFSRNWSHPRKGKKADGKALCPGQPSFPAPAMEPTPSHVDWAMGLQSNRGQGSSRPATRGSCGQKPLNVLSQCQWDTAR